MPLLTEVISQTLQNVDLQHPNLSEEQTLSVLRLMETMVIHAGSNSNPTKQAASTQSNNSVEDAQLLLSQFIASRVAELKPDLDIEADVEENEGDDDDDVNPPPTPVNKLVLDILQRASYFLSAPNRKVQVGLNFLLHVNDPKFTG